MIDNIKFISDLLQFSSQNDFYMIQILKRRKENPTMTTGTKVIHVYYLYSKDDLEKLSTKIIEDCKSHNARAYINLNRLDAQNIALRTMGLMVDYMAKGDFHACKNAYSTACGNFTSEKVKRWVVDLDPEHRPFRTKIIELVKELTVEIGHNVIAILPTKNGCHVISEPFNLDKFNKQAKLILEDEKLIPAIHKNSPTILYIP